MIKLFDKILTFLHGGFCWLTSLFCAIIRFGESDLGKALLVAIPLLVVTFVLGAYGMFISVLDVIFHIIFNMEATLNESKENH